MLLSSLAAAAPAATAADDVVALVQRALLTPLARREASQSRYSRMPMPPADRRARVIDAAPVEDATGGHYVSFTVDVRRHGDLWQKNAMTGCAYPKTGAVFVAYGAGKLRPAAAYLGGLGARAKAESTPASACVPKAGAVAVR